ncbi:MAG: L,D-transpeptidase family protein [Alphaproteobacteria bacterium]|nr:L,D-transpeptidase family protein [Alphaproteobacteria bacterium]
MDATVDPAGFVTVDGERFRCALGRGGLRADKREGDGATPIGRHRFGRVFWRPDRIRSSPVTELPRVAITPSMGWCDDPGHPDYNTLITLPHPARHERLWRDDPVYDVVVELLYNTDPIVPGRGSAIFMHVARPGFAPTEGCIALQLNDLLQILRIANEKDGVIVPG